MTDRYPFPRVKEVFAELGSSENLQNAHQQIALLKCRRDLFTCICYSVDFPCKTGPINLIVISLSCLVQSRWLLLTCLGFRVLRVLLFSKRLSASKNGLYLSSRIPHSYQREYHLRHVLLYLKHSHQPFVKFLDSLIFVSLD